jgi:hypothetical protein
MLGCGCDPSPHMESYFNVGDLSAEQLLAHWRWLPTAPVSLIARRAVRDQFLYTESGMAPKLEVSAGRLTKVAETVEQFHSKVASPKKRQELFAEGDERAAAQRGFAPKCW